MSAADLRSWLLRELVESGMAENQASSAASRVVEASGANPVTVATAVCAARAASRLPDGASWWSSTDAVVDHAKDQLLRGHPDFAFSLVAERLAVPAPDDWDPNWPPHKVAYALLPEDPRVGQTFVVGNGEGHRATVEVVERDGRLQAVITSASRPLEDLWDEVMSEAERVASRP